MRSEDGLGLLKKIAAGFSQSDAARRALEKLHPQPILQFQHDAADGRLGHGQTFGSAMEVQLFRNRDEGGQMFQIVAHIDTEFISIR